MNERGVKPRCSSMWWKAKRRRKGGVSITSRTARERRTVLGDVSDNQVGVLPDLSSEVGLSLSYEELDEGRLSGSVGSEDGDTGRERDLERDVVELGSGGSRVLESDVAHLHERLLLGLDSVEERRVGELEQVVLGGVELVVDLGLGDMLNEGLEVSGIPLDLEAVKVEDVGGDVVEESRVVYGARRVSTTKPNAQTSKGRTGDDDGGAGLETLKVVLQPGDVKDIEVVRGLKDAKVSKKDDRMETKRNRPHRGEGCQPRKGWPWRGRASSSTLRKGIRWRPPGARG